MQQGRRVHLRRGVVPPGLPRTWVLDVEIMGRSSWTRGFGRPDRPPGDDEGVVTERRVGSPCGPPYPACGARRDVVPRGPFQMATSRCSAWRQDAGGYRQVRIGPSFVRSDSHGLIGGGSRRGGLLWALARAIELAEGVHVLAAARPPGPDARTSPAQPIAAWFGTALSLLVVTRRPGALSQGPG